MLVQDVLHPAASPDAAENGVCQYIMSIDAEEKIMPKLGTVAQYNEEIVDLDS